jgi:serine protease Do
MVTKKEEAKEEVIAPAVSTPKAEPPETSAPKKAPARVLFAVALLLTGFLVGAVAQKISRGDLSPIQLGTKQITVQENSATIDVVNKVSPSVVSITSVQSTMDFFGRVRESKSAGTGFIVKEDGLIITNHHVVSDTKATYSVFTSDGKEYKAQIKAIDPVYDIAFLKIDAKGLKAAELADSDKIQVGEKVVAIGNALGQYQNTVTAGVVSAVGRAIEAGDSSGSGTESLENMIQTDAAINSGNSGGPLINIDGQVIGINTAVDQQGQGIGFAIPVNLAKSALSSVLANGKIIRPMLGIRYINISKEFATRNNLAVDHGALIYSSTSDSPVIAGSPAERAGLKEGDIITKVAGDEIGINKSLISLVSKYNVGDKVTITYLRDGKTKNTDIVLAESK